MVQYEIGVVHPRPPLPRPGLGGTCSDPTRLERRWSPGPSCRPALCEKASDERLHALVKAPQVFQKGKTARRFPDLDLRVGKLPGHRSGERGRGEEIALARDDQAWRADRSSRPAKFVRSGPSASTELRIPLEERGAMLHRVRPPSKGHQGRQCLINRPRPGEGRERR
jgi:hypothetical protein